MTEEGKVTVPEAEPGSICPSCGRFVGALTRCPYCGTNVEKRLSIRILRYAALLLGTVGLLFLYLMVRNREIPVVRIGDIEPTMNFAYVRVVGTVSGDTRIYKEGNRVRSLRFMVDDGTGEISVTAFRSQAQSLVAANRIPRRGDRVEVAGSLNLTADGDVVLRLQIPDHLSIHSADLEITPLAEVTEALVGEQVWVEGIIEDVFVPDPTTKNPWVVIITDGTARGELTFWRSTYEEIPNKLLLTKTQRIRARATVRQYRGKLQLSVNRGSDIEFPDLQSSSLLTAGPGVPRSMAEPAEIGDLTPEWKGKLVRVRGRVVDIKPPDQPKAPYQVILSDREHTIPIVYWPEVAQHLESNTPTKDAEMEIEGVVDIYQGNLQIKVQHSRQVRLLSPLPPSLPKLSAPTQIGSITKAQKGQTVVITGTMGPPKSIKNGLVFPVRDSSGEIEVVLWDRNVPGKDRDALRDGIKVTVRGEVGEFHDRLQIVPEKPEDIRIE